MHYLTTDDWNRAISVNELAKAAHECSKGLLWKPQVGLFMNHLDLNAYKTHSHMIKAPQKLLAYSHFHLDVPKPREIFATAFRDRVVQRALCNSGLYDALTNTSIYDSFACQKGKGSSLAYKRAKLHLERFYSEHHDRHGYVVNLDIKSYFNSIPHELLKRCMERYVNHDYYREYLGAVIDSYDMITDLDPYDEFGQRGIGLGSQLCQLMASAYLDQFDHFVKETLHVKHYMRYMDDMVMIADNLDEAEYLREQARQYVGNIGLTLNPKSQIQPMREGLVFLKTKFLLHNDGEITHKMMQPTFAKELRKINTLTRKLKNYEIGIDYYQQCLNTWLGGMGEQRCSKGQIKYIRQHIKNSIADANLDVEFLKTLECASDLEYAVELLGSVDAVYHSFIYEQIKNGIY